MAAVLVVAVEARADLTVRAQAAGALPVSAPARDYFGPGVFVGAQAGYDVASFLDVGLALDYLYATRQPASPLSGPASVLSVGPAARLHGAWSSSAMPWLSATVQYARTGELNRLALQGAVGLQFPLMQRGLWLGPFAGVQQVFHLTNDAPYPTGDATSIVLGLVVELPLLRQPVDRDGDGVNDPLDRCPDLAASTADGCPLETVSRPDTDGDGIFDTVDACKLEKEDVDGFQDEDGCPDPDDDGDGVLDADDLCRRFKGTAATRGCPDRDGDLVADNDDRCPSVKGLPANEGCPIYKSVKVTSQRLELDQKIFFAFGKTSILPRSFGLLDEVSTVLHDREGVCVRIEGHTDSVGNAQANLTLSDGRAAAVREYLVSHGIDGKRLTAKGYGSALPIDNNATGEGRDRNRRVEFVIISCSAEPTP
ncbi:MAG: OmpA family protein [Archangium sp.]|nr:OmpA family protein [Archangium sp.]